MTSHVHTISKEQFKANFIPHDPGRHRVDVKFNGEKVPNSPWFVEVKDPNTPLLAPMLVANRGSGKNGFDSKNGSTQDLSKINSSYSNKLNSELKQSSLFQQNKVESNNFTSSFNTSSSSKFESNLSSLKNGVEDLSLSKKKHNSSNSDFHKTDFGSYSLLETPKLLSGSKSSSTKTFEEERKVESSTNEHLKNYGSFSAPKTTYSTTIERSINTGTGYSSLNKPHEARVKGLTNGSSTMPKSSSLNKSVERRSSLHAKVASADSNAVSKDKKSVATNGNGHTSASFSKSSSQDMMASSSYNATTASTVQHQQTSFKSSQQSSSLSSSSRAVQESSGSKSFGPGSPKLSSYKGTAEKCKFVGETVRHFNAGKPATFELFAPGAKKGDVDVNIISEYLFSNMMIIK